MANTLVKVLDERKAFDIEVIDLAGKSSIADCMIIASGTSPRHVSTLADYVTEALKEAGVQHVSSEGKGESDWVLVDGMDVIVHIFRPEVRSFYNLEKMWQVPAPVEEMIG